MPRNIKDANLIQSRALPNGANTVTSSPIDLELGSRSDFVADAELLIEAPALAVGQLADTTTITYSIESDDNSSFTSATVYIANALVQTGAGGAGAAAATARYGLPSTAERYYRLKAVKTGAADASAATAKLSLVF